MSEKLKVLNQKLFQVQLTFLEDQKVMVTNG